MLDVRLALRALMLESSDISDAVGNVRIFPSFIPQGITADSIVYTLVSESSDYHMVGQSWLMQARYQIDCWSHTSDNAAVLSNFVNDQISGFRGTVVFGSNSPQDEIVIHGVFHDEGRESYDATTKMFRSSRDYLVWYEGIAQPIDISVTFDSTNVTFDDTTHTMDEA